MKHETNRPWIHCYVCIQFPKWNFVWMMRKYNQFFLLLLIFLATKQMIMSKSNPVPRLMLNVKE